MLLVASVTQCKRVAANGEVCRVHGLDQVNLIRSLVPAVTHVDHSARLQTVDAGRHGKFRRLLERFACRAGCPVLINTSFNVRGEPIVGTPDDAYRCFMATDMDALVLEDAVLLKSEQPAMKSGQKDEYFAAHPLD